MLLASTLVRLALISGLAQGYYHGVAKQEVCPAKDLDDIAAAARPSGFIGIVYADGNNVGARLESLQTPADYQDFAEEMYKATREAAFTALAKHLHPYHYNRRWFHPFEILSVGGDDVFLIVPAHAALPIAVTLTKHAEALLSHCRNTQTERSYQWRRIHRINPPPNWQSPATQSQISLSSGVVIANQHTPIFFLRRLVEELLKSAKAKAKELRDQDCFSATIDFIVLKSIGMIGANIRAFREGALRRNELHLTAKPYTVPEIEALLQAVKMLKPAFPKSQLYRLREQLEKGRLMSTVDYLYFQSRSSYADRLRCALDGLWTGTEQRGRVGNVGLCLPRDQSEWETILGDLLEIYDFVSE
jgi:CRISPR-associated protein Cmr2